MKFHWLAALAFWWLIPVCFAFAGHMIHESWHDADRFFGCVAFPFLMFCLAGIAFLKGLLWGFDFGAGRRNR